MMDTKQFATILQQHTRWLQSVQGGARADLRDADLWGADLQGADLRGAHLRGAHLQNADLRSADLRSADLRGAHLQDADLQGAHLQGADLQGAHLRGAHLQAAALQDAALQGADLRSAHLRDADLRDAALQGADLQGAHLQGADLWGADLRDAHLLDADLQGVAASLGIAVDPALPAKILATIAAHPEAWDQRTWHSACGTRHCIAGFATSLSGAQGRHLETTLGTATAATLLLWQPGRLLPSFAPKASAEDTLGRLRTMAEQAARDGHA